MNIWELIAMYKECLYQIILAALDYYWGTYNKSEIEYWVPKYYEHLGIDKS